jgi:hypothetical protein
MPAVGLYPTSGSSQDYAFSLRDSEDRSRISAFTIEFGSGQRGDPENIFIPKYSVMQNIILDISSAITGLCVEVGKRS